MRSKRSAERFQIPDRPDAFDPTVVAPGNSG
jgi:hypothetical protein